MTSYGACTRTQCDGACRGAQSGMRMVCQGDSAPRKGRAAGTGTLLENGRVCVALPRPAGGAVPMITSKVCNARGSDATLQTLCGRGKHLEMPNRMGESGGNGNSCHNSNVDAEEPRKEYPNEEGTGLPVAVLALHTVCYA